MDIPKEARKCPYCHHFQNRLSMIMYHPAFAVLFACLPMAAMLIVFATIFDRGENYEGYKNQIVIQDSQVFLGDTKSGATVAVLGTIKNMSPVPWKEIQFHADFLDAQGKQADVGEKEEVFPLSSSQCHVLFQGVVPGRVSRNELRDAHHQSGGGEGCAGKMATMKLTRLQYKALKIYRRYDTDGFTVGQVLRICWKQWLLMAALGLFSYFFLVPGFPALGWLYVGICGGAFFRDFGYYQVAFRMWPVTKQILDWKQVSELIESHEKDLA